MAHYSSSSIQLHARFLHTPSFTVLARPYAIPLPAVLAILIPLLGLSALLALRSARRARQLIESHAQLLAVFDTMKDGIAILDRHHNLIRTNKAAGLLLGLDARSLINQQVKNTFQVFLPDGAPLPREDWPSVLALRGEFLKSREILIRRKDTGKSVNIDISSAPLLSPAVPPGQVIITYRDITGPKSVDLIRSRLAAIVESSEDAIIGKDQNGIVTSWNKGAAKVFGFAASEMLGKSIRHLLPPELSFQLEEDDILQRIRLGQTVHHIDTVRRKKDGTLINVSLTISPIRGPNGNIVGASKIARDITEKKQLEQQLRQCQKMEAIGQLTGGIAHDFNNLLGVIIGNLELLDRLLAGNPLALKRVQTALRAAARGAKLTHRMLTFSSKDELHPRPALLSDSILNTIELAARALGAEIAVATSLDNSVPAVFVDVPALENALLNLLLNARDALPRGGAITIASQVRQLEQSYPPVQTGELKAGSYACVSVSDNGAGMSKEVLEHAFEPFYTTKPRDQGTGLGLAMVYGFVKQSGGTVRIYSELGFGTTVSLYLPLTSEPVRPPRPAPVVITHNNSGGSVLVVDDEEDLLDVAIAYLEEMGYTAFKALNGPAALAIFERHTIDLIITDILMPGGMNGVELVQRVRQISPRTRIAYCSGFPADVLAARSMPVIDGPLLHKPYQRAVFVQAVHQIMTGHVLAPLPLATQSPKIPEPSPS